VISSHAIFCLPTRHFPQELLLKADQKGSSNRRQEDNKKQIGKHLLISKRKVEHILLKKISQVGEKFDSSTNII
jgi:hypothetical protein